MSNYSAILAQINAHIKRNGNQEITGTILNGILRGMVGELGKGFRYEGVLSPSQVLSPLEHPSFFILKEAGEYPYAGEIELGDGEIAIATYTDGTWDSETILDLSGYATTTDLTSLSEIVDNIDVNLIPALQESVEGLAEDKADKSTTYTKTEVNTLLGAKANDNAVMHLSGAETITGDKIFEAPITATAITNNDESILITSFNGNVQLTTDAGDVQIVAPQGVVKIVSDGGTYDDLVVTLNTFDQDIALNRGDINTLVTDMEGKASQSDLDALAEVVGNVNDLLETI